MVIVSYSKKSTKNSHETGVRKNAPSKKTPRKIDPRKITLQKNTPQFSGPIIYRQILNFVDTFCWYFYHQLKLGVLKNIASKNMG